ncbi:MAG TPA: sulfatase-like hydrolase/transferase, partial [Planctomycetota bacterium]|nr:sulfatase-like hydrolase/transferase [Planctomycetota bacterium]
MLSSGMDPATSPPPQRTWVAWGWRGLTLAVLTIMWCIVAPWTWPNVDAVVLLSVALLAGWGTARSGTISPITMVVVLEVMTLALRLALVPRSGAALIDVALWSVLRDGVWWLPAVGCALLARRWSWFAWPALIAMTTHLLLVVLSAAVVRGMSRPLDWSLISTAFDGADLTRMTVGGALMEAIVLLANASTLLVRMHALQLPIVIQHIAIDAKSFVLVAAIIHEPLRRQLLTTHIPTHLDATNAFDPLWLTLQRWRDPRVQPLAWTEHDREVLTTWTMATTAEPRTAYADLIGRYRGMNVLILLMESFRAEALGCYDARPGTTSDSPVFDALTHEGLWFSGHVPTGQYSGHALWSILTGLAYPHPWHPLHRVAFDPQRRFTAWKWPGYQHQFICATDSRFDHYDEFTRAAGWMQVQVPLLEPHGGYGTHDEVALPWAVDHLAALDGPWVGLVFSVSNHWPFDYPDKDQRQPLRGGIRYSDHALGLALKQLRDRHPEVAARTIVVVVGDHGVRLELSPPDGAANPIFQPAANRVPLLVVLPDGQRAGVRETALTSHADLLPLLADLCGQESPGDGLGRSSLRAWD